TNSCFVWHINIVHTATPAVKRITNIATICGVNSVQIDFFCYVILAFNLFAPMLYSTKYFPLPPRIIVSGKAKIKLRSIKVTVCFSIKKAQLVRTGLFKFGAGNETRTRDPNLGKVVLYQLSYSRMASPRGFEPLLPP